MRRVLWAVVLATAACASDRGNGGSVAQAASASSKSKPSKAKPAKGSAMKGTYAAAAEAYLAHAAQKLGLAPDKIIGVGPHEAIAKMNKARVGTVWAFGARPTADAAAAEVRGWANQDGVVITPEQNLGLLFVEAGVWGGGATPALTANELAERLAWAMGADYAVFALVDKGIAGPELTMDGGAGKLTFHVNFEPPGPGRAPRQVSRVEVALGKDHSAKLTRSPIPTP